MPVTINGIMRPDNPGPYNRRMPHVNNVIRWLQAQRVKHSAFDLPAEKLGALETARLLNVPPGEVFKTIVVVRERPGRRLLVLVPAGRSVDLKLLAVALGEKGVRLPTEREAEQITGLQAGGISPLALANKGFQVVIDSRARDLPEIHVSGGERGLNIRLGVEDLARLTRAGFASVSRPEE